MEGGIEEIQELKREIFQIEIGFWERQVGCKEEKDSLIQNVNKLETLVKTVHKYVEFNCLRFKQGVEPHIYQRKVTFLNRILSTVGNLLAFLLPAFGIAVAASVFFAVSTTTKIIGGAVTGGLLLVGSVVKCFADAKARKQEL